MKRFLSRLFGRRPDVPRDQVSSYTDVYEVMRYRAPDRIPPGRLPDIYAFRQKDRITSPNQRPSFVFLETRTEVRDWYRVMAGEVVFNTDGQVTDLPLLRWNDIPSLLHPDNGMVVTCLPENMENGWPPLIVHTHPFAAELDVQCARDRYYFEQNKLVVIAGCRVGQDK